MDSIKVTILGSGTCVPSLKRSSCSVLVEVDSEKLVFDIGVGTMRRLLEAGVDISQVSHLFLSHFHPDHTGEFVSFLFANKYSCLHKERGPLKIVGSVGLRKFYEGLKNVYGNWIDPGENVIELIEMSNVTSDYLSLGFLDVNTVPMVHIESSVGYNVITPEGISVAYSGDTDYSENVAILARGADLFICESAFPDEMKVEGHLTPSLAGRIAAESGVKHLVLTHFYPECDDYDIEAECRKTYPGFLTLAEDLVQFHVSKEGSKRVR